MKTHTPGPWNRSENGGNIETEQAVICSVNDAYDGDDNEQANANARLIAAAPNLLAACQAMVSAVWQHFENYHDGDEDCGSESCQIALDKTKAAIAKAQGQP